MARKTYQDGGTAANGISKLATLMSLGVLAIVGCSGGEQSNLMPLKIGSEWKYNVSGKFAKYVEPIQINREIGVAGARGVELTSPLGNSSMVWKKGILYADRLAGTTYSPPLPLLTADGHKVDWKGIATWAPKGSVNAVAELTQESQKLKLDAHEYGTVKARLQIVLGDSKPVELTTWYAPDIGIVRQEQRSGGDLDIRIDYLGGP